jgi:hypothetical protein
MEAPVVERDDRRQRISRWFSIFLWLGGVPPVISGAVAITLPHLYANAVSERMGEFLAPPQLALLTFTISLQGGDAAVGGLARIFVAIWGNLRLKQWMGAVAILHSSFELWLLPDRFLAWCARPEAPPCRPFIVTEVWAFMALHVVLVVGFATLLLRSREADGATKAV